MNFPFYIAKRYAFSKSKSKAINIITAIAAIGIVVSSMSMLVVMSVFSGLREFTLSFTNELDPELKVFSVKGKTFKITDDQFQKLNSSSSFDGVSRIVEDRVLFLFKEKQVVAHMKGVDSLYLYVNNMDRNVLYGHWIEDDDKEVVVGMGISYRLSMGLFDTENLFKVYAMKPGKGSIDNLESAFNERFLNPVGIYSIKNDDLDEKYVFTSLYMARDVLGFESDEITNLEIKLAPKVVQEKAIAEIKSILGDQVIVKDRIQLNESLYRMLNTENIVVYLIFTLVVIITLFNLIGALIMIILEKQKNIKTLYNLGVREGQLKNIFLFQGLVLSFFGGLIGVILGIVLVFLQQEFGLLEITEGLPFPVKFTFFNIFIVCATIMFLAFIASYIASSRVNKKYLSK